MEEGLPIAYQMLDEGVPVLACDGEQVGTVGSVLSAPEEDVFHGLLINTPAHGIRFWRPTRSPRSTNMASICASTRPRREAFLSPSTRHPCSARIRRGNNDGATGLTS